MATLTSQSIKDTYKDMVHLYDATSATGQGFESSLKTLYDGEGTEGPIKMSATHLNIPSGKTLSVDGSLTGTFTDLGLPSQTSNSGKFLKTNGSVSSWDTVDTEITAIGTLTGATPLVFEGATANDFETTFAITDPTADRTLTFPDTTGTVALVGDTNHTHSALTGVILFDAGGTASLPTIAKTDEVDTGIYFPASDTIGFTTGGTERGYIGGSGNLVWAGEASFGGDVQLNNADLVFEGATANDYETTLTVTDPTADRTITLPDATGTVELTGHTHSGYATSGTNADITSMTALGLTPLVIEGTADNHETSLKFTDPTADRNITFPDATGTVITSGNLTAINGTLGASVIATNKLIAPEFQAWNGSLNYYSAMSYSAANLIKIGKSDTGSSIDHCDVLIDVGTTLVIKGLLKQSTVADPESPPGVIEGGMYSDGENFFFGSTDS
jgi:hypothetical protein